MGDKPMLILELDEHGGDAGYLTRIEAFIDVIESNTLSPKEKNVSIQTNREKGLKDRVLWIPTMHKYHSELFAAVFRADGVESYALPLEDEEALEIGKKACRGSECLPANLTIGAFLKKMREPGTQNKKHAFFMPGAAGPCRFGQYSVLHRMILDNEKLEDVPIVSPSSQNAYLGLEQNVRKKLWESSLFADFLFKIGCRIRPYELNRGETEKTLQTVLKKMLKAIESNSECDILATFQKHLPLFEEIPQNRTPRPLVGVVGEIYVRANSFANQNVISKIEHFGGEAWLAPIYEWLAYSAYIKQINSIKKPSNWKDMLTDTLVNRHYLQEEEKWHTALADILADRLDPPIAEVVETGASYLPLKFQGESILTVGRALLFIRDKASLIVNCAPFSCMPGTITISLFQEIQKEQDVPIVNLVYDGTGDRNQCLDIYLKNLKNPAPVGN